MKHRKKRKVTIIGIVIGLLLICAGIVCWIVAKKEIKQSQPEELIVEYMNHIEKKEYDAMYDMIDKNTVSDLGEEGFIERNSKIYEGIEVENLKIDNIIVGEQKNKVVSVLYNISFETVAGTVTFTNEAKFIDTESGYKILWDDSLIFPKLDREDKVRVSTIQAERGEITDRNGNVLAGKGEASSVGVVPGKLENRDESLQKLAKLLDIEIEVIKNKLEAKWVKDDSFVPIVTITKIQELDLMELQPDKELLNEKKRQDQLLEIPGVMLSDVEVRTYELGEAASHLIGYVQGVTAEDLKNHPDEGYSSSSVIGKSGMEGLYEKELKGQDGYEICIVDENGDIKEVVAEIAEEDGEDINLTIDYDLQKSLYEQVKDDAGCSVAINPYTGEVLALVSTPSYDSNDFIKGLSTEQWESLNEDEDKPMLNRFRQVWCPGSTFKPIIAAIGLKSGAVDWTENFGNEGRSWQKDTSWGDYYVTTLKEYEPVSMKNAIMYSDNIYFAKAALKIGADNMAKSLNALGFNQELPFEIVMPESQYSNTDKIETEIQLADTGYGQGQVLVNPLHLASIYTAFLNDGDVIKPYLKYKENTSGEAWISQAFSEDIVNKVLEGLESVVNNPNGTAYSAHREDIVLAGKTGTAEIKATKEDTEGTEIGWFAVFTTDKNAEKPIMIISMIENVKGKGGSSLVVKKDKAVLDEYLK